MAESTGEKRPRRGKRGCDSKRVGQVLLQVHQALRKLENCRRYLRGAGFSERRWLEIINDVNPELRFAMRPRLLDEIVEYLDTAGQPVARDLLVRELAAQGAGLLVRVRHCIAVNLRNKSLALFPGDRIGLPEWKKSVEESG